MDADGVRLSLWVSQVSATGGGEGRGGGEAGVAGDLARRDEGAVGGSLTQFLHAQGRDTTGASAIDCRKLQRLFPSWESSHEQLPMHPGDWRDVAIVGNHSRYREPSCTQDIPMNTDPCGFERKARGCNGHQLPRALNLSPDWHEQHPTTTPY